MTPIATILAAAVTVFANYSTGVAYRIPALTQTRDGELVAVADYRFCASDIGWGPIDLHISRSADLGKSWSAPECFAPGDSTLAGNQWNYAYGDPSIIADRESDEILVMSCGGHTPFFQATAESPMHTVRHRSHDGGKTWPVHESVTRQIYSLFDGRPQGPVQSLFFTSGRMVQSKRIKQGSHYRIYCALPVRPGGIYVLFSDDFGQNWKILGDKSRPASTTLDECKVEELPDGSVAISIRKRGARGFNVFHYSDIPSGRGAWDDEVDAPAMNGVNDCNGGFAIMDARRPDGTPVRLMLQSITFRRERYDVGIFFKEMPDRPLTAEDFKNGWRKGLQLEHGSSAYSCLLPLRDGSIAAFWESDLKDDGFDLLYRRLDASEITLGNYSPAAHNAQTTTK